MHKLFKDWNLFEILLLFIGFLLVILASILSKSSFFAFIVSLLTIGCAIMQAKGKAISQLIGLIQCVLYTYLSFCNRFFGEVLINIFLMLPLYAVGVISWFFHTDQTTHTVIKREVSKKEWLVLSFLSLGLSIGLYFLLRYFHTDKLLVSTISMVFSLFATYLVSRRNKFGFLFYCLNDIVLCILWGSLALFTDFSLLPMLIMPMVLFVNDVYGWIMWNKSSEEAFDGS